MKSAIIKIDRAIKSIYNLDVPHKAENFLLTKSPNGNSQSALYIKSEKELLLGIYLNSDIEKTLLDFSLWKKPWTPAQLSAFSVATEEVSHFLYLLHHVEKGRGVSHWELELQAEIDKFVLAFFAQLTETSSRAHLFDHLFESFFTKFQWGSHLNEAQLQRYEEASQCAKGFIKHLRELLKEKIHTKALALLRSHYRWDTTKKIENFWEKI